MGDKLILKGQGLDLKTLNTQYRVTLYSTINPSSNGTSCRIVAEEITDTEVPCIINDVPSYGVQYTIKVRSILHFMIGSRM